MLLKGRCTHYVTTGAGFAVVVFVGGIVVAAPTVAGTSEASAFARTGPVAGSLVVVDDTDADTADVGAVDMVDMAAVDAGAADVGAADVGAADAGAGTVGAADLGVAEVGVVYLGAVAVGTADVGAANLGAVNVGAVGLGAADVGTADLGTAVAGSAAATGPTDFAGVVATGGREAPVTAAAGTVAGVFACVDRSDLPPPAGAVSLTTTGFFSGAGAFGSRNLAGTPLAAEVPLPTQAPTRRLHL